MNAQRFHYLLLVMVTFGVAGPLIPVAVTMNPVVFWIALLSGGIPALLAGGIYFLVTFAWFERKLAVSDVKRALLFASVGAASGAAGLVAYCLMPYLHENDAFSGTLRGSPNFLFMCSAIGGAGCALLLEFVLKQVERAPTPGRARVFKFDKQKP